MSEQKKKKHCVDCGGAQVNHKLVYISIWLSAAIEPWTNWMGRLIPEEKLEWLGPILTKTLLILHLGKMTYAPSEKDSLRARVLWEEAQKRNINLKEFLLFGIGRDVFTSKYKNETRFFDVLPRTKDYNPKGLEWMDNKNEMKKHFKLAGIPVATGGIASSKKEAIKIFNSLDKPVIAKPNLGSRSRHTTTHISNEEELVKAYKLAHMLSPWVMIEEELTGYVFRGTLIGKKFVACLRREPAYVIGDGVHTVKELIDIENKNPLRAGPIFHQLSLDEEAIKELTHWGKTSETIPKKDEIITLGQKTSRAVGGGITDMTEVIHPDNIAMLEKIAEVLDDPLIGVDFIMNDVSISWKDQPRSGVIECNSAPFIDLHHFPLVGKPHNVAGKLWDIIYPESKISE
jgi:D-alanine-D-alanine ligase-like ATP-grasp enzyme